MVIAHIYNILYYYQYIYIYVQVQTRHYKICSFTSLARVGYGNWRKIYASFNRIIRSAEIEISLQFFIPHLNSTNRISVLVNICFSTLGISLLISLIMKNIFVAILSSNMEDIIQYDNNFKCKFIYF